MNAAAPPPPIEPRSQPRPRGLHHHARLIVFGVAALSACGLFALGIHSFAAQRDASAPPASVAPLRADATVVGPDGAAISVHLADTPADRTQGLSGQPSLGEDQGMLFLFPTPARHTFWMKDMRFPIDILWLQNGRVVELWENAPPPAPGTFPAARTPEIAADAVLELPAGQAARRGLLPGAALDILLPDGYIWPAN